MKQKRGGGEAGGRGERNAEKLLYFNEKRSVSYHALLGREDSALPYLDWIQSIIWSNLQIKLIFQSTAKTFVTKSVFSKERMVQELIMSFGHNAKIPECRPFDIQPGTNMEAMIWSVFQNNTHPLGSVCCAPVKISFAYYISSRKLHSYIHPSAWPKQIQASGTSEPHFSSLAHPHVELQPKTDRHSTMRCAGSFHRTDSWSTIPSPIRPRMPKILLWLFLSHSKLTVFILGK